MSKPKGWQDGGDTFWIKSSAYGQRYRCKTCGCEQLGYSSHNHRTDCASPHAVEQRERAALNRFLACLPALRVAARNIITAGALTHEYARGRAAGIDDGKWIADQFGRLPPGTDDTGRGT